MAQSSGFYRTLKVETCCKCKLFDVSNWVAHRNGEDGPRGTPSHETLSVSLQGVLQIFLVFGHPPSLVRDHFTSPRVVAKSSYEGTDLHPKTTVSKSLQTPQTKVT